MNLESCANTLSRRLFNPLLSLLKVAVRSRRASRCDAVPSAGIKPMIIMGNGPSLRSFLDFLNLNPDLRRNCALEAVNFAAITPEFRNLRPEAYILADPHFFEPQSADPKVVKLHAELKRCDWPMTLWLPIQHRRAIEKSLLPLPANIFVKWMNLTPVEGEGYIADRLIHSGLAMPRPRNVLIPAIICAIRSGYKDIFLVGADHSWSKTLWVDDANRVVSVQPHFYKDDEKEKARVEAEYAGYHLHDILNSLTVAFRSYFQIRNYASRHGISIINATPDSFIDAFPRCNYEQIRPQ